MLLFIWKVMFLNEKVDSKIFRELIMLFEQKLELLNKQDTCCSEVSLAQCHALVEIGRANTISLKDLANTLGLDISTMSRTVENLVKKNFVFRFHSKIDRRSIDIQLTDVGLNVFADIEMKMNNKFNSLLEQISPKDQSTVFDGLNIIIEALSKEHFKSSNNK